MIFEYFRQRTQARRKKRDAQERQRGFEYALSLLRQDDDMSLEYLKCHLEESECFHDYTAFDQGIEDALHEHNTRNRQYG